MRQFETGATRDTDTGKIDYDGFLSPLALEEFGKYMNTHRVQADGELRDSDNWQRGIPIEQYRKSLWRHHIDVWKLSRGYEVPGVTLTEALCAVLFNAQGMLHEVLKQEDALATKRRRERDMFTDLMRQELKAATEAAGEWRVVSMPKPVKPKRKPLRSPDEKPVDGPMYYEKVKEPIMATNSIIEDL